MARGLALARAARSSRYFFLSSTCFLGVFCWFFFGDGVGEMAPTGTNIYPHTEVCPIKKHLTRHERSTGTKRALGSLAGAKGMPVTTTARARWSAKSMPSDTCKMGGEWVCVGGSGAFMR